MPHRVNTKDGRRHVQIAPVKLLRPETNLRKSNPDRMFAKSFTDDMKNIDEQFGNAAVTYLSFDDKAKVPIGLTAAKAQAPLLMHVEYKVRLNDHDFVIGGQHKLIPSVYAECEITQEGKVSYSGDTHISIRSGKHDSSTAYTHHHDIMNLFESKAIKRKSILVLESDGAQDVTPRYPKGLACAVALFKKLGLDALIHGVNAAGLSAFNPGERRMAPLSHDLSGIIISYSYSNCTLNAFFRFLTEEKSKLYNNALGTAVSKH